MNFYVDGRRSQVHAGRYRQTSKPRSRRNHVHPSVPPVVVIGAGPIGLAAAAHLSDHGLNPVVLEAGHTAGTAVHDWAHVRLFSTWGEVFDPAAEKLLAPTGWSKP